MCVWKRGYSFFASLLSSGRDGNVGFGRNFSSQIFELSLALEIFLRTGKDLEHFLNVELGEL